MTPPTRRVLGIVGADGALVVGSCCGRFPPALVALAAGRVAVAPRVDAVYPLDDADGAFAHAATPGTLKVLVDAQI